MKFDHLNLPVGDRDRSRAWYVATLGLEVECWTVEPSRCRMASGFALLLQDKPSVAANGVALWLEVDDVDAIFAAWAARAVNFVHGPKRPFGRMAQGLPIGTAISCGSGMSAR